jgi:hypothetical protein
MMTFETYFQIKVALSAAVAGLVLSKYRGSFSLKGSFSPGPSIDGFGVETLVVNKNKRSVATIFRTPLPLDGVVFHFNLENWMDGFFKRNGLVIEPQVGDVAFDSKYYIRSDSPSFLQFLKTEREFRAALGELFRLGAKIIFFEDGQLNVRFSGDQCANREMSAAFVKLRQTLSSVGTRIVAGDDPYLAPIQRLKALIYGFGMYGLISYFEAEFTKGTIFVNLSDFLYRSVILGLAALVLFCAVVFGYLRSSSRAPRFLTETGFVILVLGLPAAIGLFADIDRYFDHRQEIVVERVVSTLNTVERHTRRGSTTEYHACFEPAALAGRSVKLINLPDCLLLGSTEYFDLKVGDGVRLHVGRGFLGVPWYRRLQRLER